MARNVRIDPPSLADLVYDAFYVGGIGGSIVALFFLARDLWQGEPLFTPSVVGTALFTSTPADALGGVRLDMVAAFTAVHFAAFSLLGIAVAFLVRELELHAKHPLIVGGLIFALAEAGFFTAAALWMPGVIEVIGAGWIAAANLLAATGVALFLLSSHRPDVWHRLKHALHLA
jgi:hypothetical protein